MSTPSTSHCHVCRESGHESKDCGLVHEIIQLNNKLSWAEQSPKEQHRTIEQARALFQFRCRQEQLDLRDSLDRSNRDYPIGEDSL